MGERQNTILCTFDLKSPHISAYDIHEWIYVQLRLEDNEVLMVQTDGPQRRVYIKLRDNDRLQVLHLIGGQAEYRHTNGEVSMVRVETVGLGTRRVRIVNLPPEVPEEVIRTTMARYRRNKGCAGRDLVPNVSIQSGKWRPHRGDDACKTHSVEYHYSRTQGASVLRGSTDVVLQMPRNGPFPPSMPNEAESRRNRAHCHRHFMGGYCGTRSRRHTEE